MDIKDSYVIFTACLFFFFKHQSYLLSPFSKERQEIFPFLSLCATWFLLEAMIRVADTVALEIAES